MNNGTDIADSPQLGGDGNREGALADSQQATTFTLSSFGGLSRENIFWAGILTALVAILVAGGAVVMVTLAVVVFSPIWIPAAVLSSPILLITSPLWLTLVGLGIFLTVSCLSCGGIGLAVFVFFLLPAEYLPSESTAAATFLNWRDRATVLLVKLQAKIVLYAAGVGPLADAALAILDHVDLQQLQDFVEHLDWETVVQNVQRTDPKEIPGRIISLVRSILKI